MTREIKQSLTPRELAFIRLYPTSSSGAEAAAKAGWSRNSAATIAMLLLKKPEIRYLIQKEMAKHAQRISLKGDEIARYWQQIAYAELPLPDVGCCRYCHGMDHDYQFTLNEWRVARGSHILAQMKKPQRDRKEFDERGGIGFDRTLPPHPECPECNGLGINYPMVIDRDKLTPAQRAAMDEVRVMKDGSVSLRMRDRSRAMENLQKLLQLVPLGDPVQSLEEQVDNLLRTAIDRGMVTLPQSYIDHDLPTDHSEIVDASAEV